MGETSQKEKEIIREELVTNSFPKYYKILNDLVGETHGEFIAGHGIKNISWADLFLANWLEIWSDTLVSMEFFNQYPVLKTLYENVFRIPQIAEYIKIREKTYL